MTRAFEKLFAHPATRPLDVEWIDAYARRRPARFSAPIDIAPEPPRQGPPANEVQKEALDALERTRAAGNSAGLGGPGHRAWARRSWRPSTATAPSTDASCSSRTARRSSPRRCDTFRWHAARRAPRSLHGTGEDCRTPTCSLPRFRPWAACAISSASTARAFDYIVVDEFHHAAAATYRRLIDYFQPEVPARAHRHAGAHRRRRPARALPGEPGLPLRLHRRHPARSPVPIPLLRRSRRGRLRQHPLAQLPLRRGGADQGRRHAARAQNALEQYRERRRARGRSPSAVSQRHADFMADFFRNARPARVRRCTPVRHSDPRAASLEQLRAGELDVVFAVDMFNEGVDVPAVDTVMMLRPTESRIVWLQQFGRGLRKRATARRTSRSSTTSATTGPSCSSRRPCSSSLPATAPDRACAQPGSGRRGRAAARLRGDVRPASRRHHPRAASRSRRTTKH